MDSLIEVLTASVARRLEQAAANAGVKAPPRPATPGAPRRTPSPAPPPRPAPAAEQAPSLDDFGGALGGLDGFPAASAGPAGGPQGDLLAAFGGGRSLLAGIILSEALAPPLALRPHRVER
jgi:hypothetical protein